MIFNLIGKHFQAHPDHLPLCLLHLCRPTKRSHQEEFDEEADIHNPDGNLAAGALGKNQQEDQRDSGHETRFSLHHRDGLLLVMS